MFRTRILIALLSVFLSCFAVRVSGGAEAGQLRRPTRPASSWGVPGAQATWASETAGASARGKGNRERLRKIEWPSREFPTIQSALDALADGGRLEIADGDYRVDEPLFVVGKRVVIQGAGSGRHGERRVTRLLGPAPTPVVDREGNITLRAQAVQGVFNFVAARAVVQHMMISGGDAAIVTKDDAEGNAARVSARDLVIADTGRGILSLSSGQLTVANCTVMDCLWNGVSVAPNPAAVLTKGLKVYDVMIVDPEGAGIYFTNTWAIVNGVTVENAQHGGIVGYKAKAAISYSTIRNNWWAGIVLAECQATPLIMVNLIENTWPVQGLGGDGIILFLSNGDLRLNQIKNSARASVSVFGGTVSFLDNTMTCASFDIQVEDYGGVQSQLNDLGGNLCGCGSPLGPCSEVSSTLEPPAPVGGLE